MDFLLYYDACFSVELQAETAGLFDPVSLFCWRLTGKRLAGSRRYARRVDN